MGEDKDVWWYMDPVKEMIFSVETVDKPRSYTEALEHALEIGCVLLPSYVETANE